MRRPAVSSCAVMSSLPVCRDDRRQGIAPVALKRRRSGQGGGLEIVPVAGRVEGYGGTKLAADFGANGLGRGDEGE